jgi:hypothetical protein
VSGGRATGLGRLGGRLGEKRAARRLLAAALAAGGGGVSSFSCANDTIVLATLPDTDAGAPLPPARCVVSLDCPPDSFCSKETCASAAGTCRVAQTGCEGESPVCGCDNVTYFNDCLRQANRVSSFTPNECQTGAARCGGSAGASCPAGASCFARQLQQLQHGPCPRDLPGSCWVVPATCPSASGPERWDSCDETLSCVDTCTAIRSGATVHPALICP